MRLMAILMLGAIAVGAASRCDPPPSLAEFVRTLPSDSRARRAAIEERLRQAPDDFTLNRLLVDSSVYQRHPIRERYRALLERNAGSLDYRYLQARTLVGSDTKEALRLYGQILQIDPDYPWIHISQLEIYRSEVFRDRPKLAASFAVVTRVCPDLLQPYRYLNEIADNDMAARAARKLRAMLEDAKDPGESAFFPTLWSVEFRVRPTAEQDEERKRVAEDLKRLMPLQPDGRIQGVIETGAKLAGDNALAKRMAASRKPDVNRIVMESSNAWFREHPAPKDGDGPDKRRAYGKDLLPKSEEWQRIAPEDVIGYYQHVRALIFVGAGAEEIERAGDEMLRLIRSRAGIPPSWIVPLARAYVEGGVLLDRIPALVAEAIKGFDDPEAVIEIDLAPNHEITSEHRQRLIYDHASALLALARAYEKLGDGSKAHETLWQAADYLGAKAPAREQIKDRAFNWHTMARYELLRTRAEMAESEGRKLDALNGYRETLAVRPIERDELLARQRRLWKDLGGSDEGWQEWAASIADATPKTPAPAAPDRPEFAAVNRKLPPLSARDTEGNLWTLDRLAGKTTIAVVWATWCEPCRAELPYFGKLVEKLKGRDDVLAISFNTDDNLAIAQAFAKSSGYAFTIVGAKQYAEDLMPLFAIPRTWIIHNGAITEEHVGFGRDGDKWVEEMLSRLK